MSRTPNDRHDTWPADMVGGSSPPGPRVERYEMIRERARGGLGRVVEAHDRTFRRVVAVKELLHNDEAGQARFVREAFITASLQHPSIVPVYDAASGAEGEPFYVMKLVSGRTLTELVEERRTLRERLALLPNVIAVVDAIAYAHSQGVLHRDVKGSNVIVGEFGETIVIDWGLAKRVEEGDDPSRNVPRERAEDGGLTVQGAILGTPAFMAPEQARGEQVDVRSDVYALGALLYFVLVGRGPYEGVEMLRLIDEVRTGSAPPIRAREPEVARDLAAIVDRAMARDAGQRYPTARELVEDLRRFQAGGLVAAHRYTAVDKVARALRRHLGVALATGVFLLAGAVAFAAFALRAQTLRRVAEQARDRAATEQQRADHQSLVLIEQQGREELEAGRPLRAAVYLAAAYLRDPDSLGVRSQLTEALKPLAAHERALVGHVRDVLACAYSPDGSHVATASDDRTVRIWNAATGETLHTIEGFPGPLEWVEFSNDGRALVAASGGARPMASTWDVASGENIAKLYVPTRAYRVAFTPDDRAVVVATGTGLLRVIDLATGAARIDTAPHTDRIAGISFRAGTSEMAIGARDHLVTFWDWRTGKRLGSLGPFDHRISSLRYSRDGRYLLLGEMERFIDVYDATTRARVRVIHLPEEARDPDVYFSPDARLVVAGTKDGRVRIWHTSSGALMRTIEAQPVGQLYHMAMRNDGTEVVTTGGDGSVQLWSLDTAGDFRLLSGAAIDDGEVLTSVYIDGGRTIVAPRNDDTVRLLDAETGALELSFPVVGNSDTIAVNADATRLAATGESRSFPPRVWDLKTGALVAVLQPQAWPQTYGLAATSDGAAFLTGDYVGVLREWDAATGRLRAEHGITDARISSIAASPDGHTLAIANERGEVQFVDRTTGETQRVLQAHTCWIQSMTYADGGRVLITAGRQDQTVKLWREPFETPLVLAGHAGQMQGAMLSDDGLRVASSSNGDATVRLWDAHTGEQLRVIHGPNTTAAFRPGTDEMLTTGEKGYVVAWNVALDARSPAEIAAYVAERSPWRLEGGRLVLVGAK